MDNKIENKDIVNQLDKEPILSNFSLNIYNEVFGYDVSKYFKKETKQSLFKRLLNNFKRNR